MNKTSRIPESTSKASRIPESTSKTSQIPESTIRPLIFPDGCFLQVRIFLEAHVTFLLT